MLVRGFRILFLLVFATLQLASCSGSSTGTAPERPNILFVIMDDVGIDQMPSFGYGGATPPNMPNIDAVAQAGLRFGNTWSMPECSPGRAAMFVGRYPLRTNIYQAIGENDLANSQITPDDMTTPKLLRTAGYESGLFGKFHLAGPENNAAGNGTPGVLGWDYFYGWVGGLPASIDTTAGGVAPQGTYPCGFVPPASRGGADSGACYLPDKTCQPLVAASPGQDAVGKQCVTRGGIFVPRAACQATPPASLDFGKANAYYVSPLVINSAAGVEVVPLTDRRARGYRTSIEVDAAINWIRQRSRWYKGYLQTTDAFIASKVKATMVDAKDVQANAFKVVVERAVVFLMGRVTEREAGRGIRRAPGERVIGAEIHGGGQRRGRRAERPLLQLGQHAGLAQR